jgi:hypothetical protein
MLHLFLRASKRKRLAIVSLIILFLAASLIYGLRSVRAQGMTSVSNQANNSQPNATNVVYTTTFTPTSTSTAIKCIQVAFTTSTASPSSAPTGLTAVPATKNSVAGTGLTDGNWSLVTPGTNNVPVSELQYEGAVVQTPGGAITIVTGNAGAGITNPSSAGVYYVQIRTYTDLTGHACTGLVDYAAAAFAITNGQALSVTVDPTLTFSINGVASGTTINDTQTNAATVTSANTIPMANVNGSTNSIAAQQLIVSTNATNGYTVYASYSGTLAFGTNTIADWTGTNATPTRPFATAGSASRFGYSTDDTNLTRFSTGAQQYWAGFQQWGYPVATYASAVSSDTNNVLYQVSVSGSQAAGTYTSTIILTAVPSY